MAAITSFCDLIGIDSKNFRKEEFILLEAEILRRICEEVRDFFRNEHKFYFRSMKFTTEMENTMLDSDFVYLVTKDILLTNEYTVEGIARYMNLPEDVVYEVVSGCNKNPSAMFFLRIMELHRLVRRELYDVIFKKILAECLSAA